MSFRTLKGHSCEFIFICTDVGLNKEKEDAICILHVHQQQPELILGKGVSIHSSFLVIYVVSKREFIYRKVRYLTTFGR